MWVWEQRGCPCPLTVSTGAQVDWGSGILGGLHVCLDLGYLMTLSLSIRTLNPQGPYQGVLSWVLVGRAAKQKGRAGVVEVLFCLGPINLRAWHLRTE